MRFMPVVCLLALALVAAGCGARSNTPYTATATAQCLRSHDFTNVSTSPGKVGFIAGFAPNGGLIATSPADNQVTIAFTKDSDSVQSTEQAFKLHASPSLRPHIADIMRTDRNAVMVWTTTPADSDTAALQSCLRS
jgi:hypothetical protein